MSLWVKICGNTNLQDAVHAAESGADALGFIFAKSPRRVSPQEAAAIVRGLPASVEKIGVFVASPMEEIAATVRICALTGVQLHSAEGAEVPERLRQEFGAGLRILRVVHFGPQAAKQVAAYGSDPNVDAILVDSRTAVAVGGTGVAFDWDEAAKSVFGAKQIRLIAAGGLDPDNVAAAITILHPWGVDVASGVEATPGQKDAARVRAFIQNARR